MRRNSDNPCLSCPKSRAGCGKHAECEQYLEYHKKRKEMAEERIKQVAINDYTTREVAKSRTGHSATRKLRPRERR